jgi:hypothetical protein
MINLTVQEKTLRSGIIILSTGEDRRWMLRQARDSVKRHNPEMPIHILSDSKQDASQIVNPLLGYESRFYKTKMIAYSPFEVGMMMDDDAVVDRQLPSLLDALCGAEIGMCRNFGWPYLNDVLSCGVELLYCSQEEIDYTRKVMPYDAHFYNAGTLLFKKTQRSIAFAWEWYAEWLRFKGPDQLAFVRALQKTPILFRELPPQWNEQNTHPIKCSAEPYVRHFILNKSESSAAWRKAHNLPNP